MSNTTRFHESRTAEQMAAGLRQAHAARGHERPDPDETAASLRALGDLERIPAVARAGPASLPIKAARAVLRVLLRPWTAVQTQANHEVARRLAELSASAHDITRRVPQVEDSVVHLERRLRSLEGRPDDLAPHSRAPIELSRLECAFVQMHLGPAPGRVLVLASQPRFATELAAFGFEVSWLPSSPSSPLASVLDPTPGVQVLDAANVPPAVFDIVVRLPEDGAPLLMAGAVAATALRLEGRLIGAWRRSEALPWLDSSSHERMHVEVAMRVEPTAGAWQVRTASPAGDPRQWEGAESMLLRARRFDAPGG